MVRSSSRNTVLFLIIIFLSAIMGILSRKLDFLPVFIEKYAGDTFWAVGAFFLFKFFLPQKNDLHIAGLSLTFCFLTEFSQLYHAPWINAIRNTFLGGLALGFGFQLSDLLCYIAGTALAFLLGKMFKTK